jgi:hypothetical protein
VSNPLRRYLEARRTRRRAKERADADLMQLSLVRKMADYDAMLPPALAAHMRQDFWNDTSWLFAAIAMLDEPQKTRILGHRIRIAAGWSVDEATIDSTEPGTVRAVHAARQVWIAAGPLYTVAGKDWWGGLTVGGFLPDGSYGPAQADRGPSQIEAEALARSVPELLARLAA